MNCRETTFTNHNHMLLWIQIHWGAWYSSIHSWPKTRKCDQHFYIWTIVSGSTNTNLHWWKPLFPRASAPNQVLNFLSLFLFDKILWMSLRRFNLTMTFFDESLGGKWWQSSTKVGLIGTSIPSKISKTFDSRFFSATLAAIHKISRHSLLEYCSLA